MIGTLYNVRSRAKGKAVEVEALLLCSHRNAKTANNRVLETNIGVWANVIGNSRPNDKIVNRRCNPPSLGGRRE